MKTETKPGEARRSPKKPEEVDRCKTGEKKKGHGFQNFSQKGAKSPRKKVKGYSAT